MPSGAKKRKAAKKKKETGGKSSSGASPQGNDGLRIQDDRESDGAEVISPTSQNDQHPFAEQEEKEGEKRDAQFIQSSVDEYKSVEQILEDENGTREAEGEGVVEIVRELKSEDVSESQNVGIEHVKSIKVSGDGDLSGDSGSSNSSSSDDESQVTKKGSEVVETIPVDDLVKPDFTFSEEVYHDTKSPPVEGAYDSVVETASVVDSIKPEVSSSEQVNLISETVLPGADTSLPEEVACDTKSETGEKAYDLAVETSSVVDSVKPEVPLSEEVNLVLETVPVGEIVEPDISVTEEVNCDSKRVPGEEAYNLAVEIASVDDSIKPEVSLAEEVDLVLDTVPVGELVKPDASLSEEVNFDSKSVPGKEAYNLAAETASFVDSVKPEVSLSEVVNLVLETVPVGEFVKEYGHLSEEVTSDTKSVPGEKADNLAVETASVVDFVKPEVSLTEVVNLALETAPVGEFVKEYGHLCEEVTSDTKSVPGEKADNLAVETASVVDVATPEVSVSEEIFSATDSASLGNALAACAVEFGLKEYGEKQLPSSSLIQDVPPVLVDFLSKKTEDKVFPLPYEAADPSSVVASSEVHENEEEPLPSSDAPSFETNNGAEHVKDSEVSKSAEKQPPVASAPQVVQKTSWLSCCGLFEMLTGSNR